LAGHRHARVSRAAHQFLEEHGDLGRPDVHRSDTGAAGADSCKKTQPRMSALAELQIQSKGKSK